MTLIDFHHDFILFSTVLQLIYVMTSHNFAIIKKTIAFHTTFVRNVELDIFYNITHSIHNILNWVNFFQSKKVLKQTDRTFFQRIAFLFVSTFEFH